MKFIVNKKGEKLNHEFKKYVWLHNDINRNRIDAIFMAYKHMDRTIPKLFNSNNMIDLRSIVHSHQIGHCRRCRVIIIHTLVRHDVECLLCVLPPNFLFDVLYKLLCFQSTSYSSITRA
jgi:hypothetical protein